MEYSEVIFETMKTNEGDEKRRSLSMSIQKILNNAAKDLQKLVEKHKNFVKKITKIIKRKTLDSHFLVRSVETGFSYDWGEVGKDFNKKGLSGLHVLMKKNYHK